MTPVHPFWSVTRDDFVPAGELVLGEEVVTIDGQIWRLTSITPRAGPETVYNFEVAGEHVYYVTSDGLLVHNSCGSWVYAVVNSAGKPIYIGTGTWARTQTVLARVAKRLGYKDAKALKNAGYKLVSADMNSKAAARAAENWLQLQALKNGMRFRRLGEKVVENGNVLINRNWGFNWLRRDKDAMSYIDEFARRTDWSKIKNWLRF